MSKCEESENVRICVSAEDAPKGTNPEGGDTSLVVRS